MNDTLYKFISHTIMLGVIEQFDGWFKWIDFDNELSFYIESNL